MTRLFVLIRSLEIGGAERQLVEIVRGLDKRDFAVTVATLYDGGALRPEIEAIEGVRVISLRKRSRWDVSFLWNLWMAVRECRAQILFGDMSPANELCSLVGMVTGAKIVWCLQSAYIDFARYDWLPAFLHRVGAILSRTPDLIIANSHAGRLFHAGKGYRDERMIVIHNGIDTSTYRPDPGAGQCVRAEWNVEEGSKLIGLVARLDPIKDHQTFLRAAAILAGQRKDVRFVCVGGGSGAYARELREFAASRRIGVIWGGTRRDMCSVYNALDVACCSSYGEGFPNAVAEAMACGVPCVATDVGDLSLLLGTTGVIVPPRDPQAMAVGMSDLLQRLESNREACRRLARERILSQFSLEQLWKRTSDALHGLLTTRV
jgi:glycosyltransferase involved in cell wall biosynthesis